MSELIAGTYQIIKQIGSGGGGVVYLAYHVRLDKKVVLKADKRKITTRPELLRVEVDVLKHLSHQYIPQVYDFFIEDDTVYTAMAYIEGDSFDRFLKRGERFAQPQVIKWGCQLLEALAYLHSPTHGDPPHGYTHSDIKPANLMLTPQGDICLIDFNISLALGEEMIIGRSEGYASPEHYGLDFSNEESYTGRGETSRSSPFRRTTTGRSSFSSGSGAYRSGSVSGYQLMRPDVRSDIYSTGATLYHLLSGRRPASNAKRVEPLSEKEFSPQLVRIISKSMEPNPNLRYQTAEEMLEDLRKIREIDPRVLRIRRERLAVCASLALLILAGAGTAFVGLKGMQTEEARKNMAEYSANAYQEGDQEAALTYALQALPDKSPLKQEDCLPEAQNALTNALGVYDLSDGYKTHGVLELPSAPLYMEMSPEGTTVTCVCSSVVQVYETDSGRLLAELPAVDSALAEASYLDENAIVYAGAGGIARYDIDTGTPVWTGEDATGIAVSGDGSRVAGIFKDESRVSVYDAETGQFIRQINLDGRHQSVVVNDVFANPNDNLLSLNEDGTLLAVSMSDGSLEIFDLNNGRRDMILMDDTSGYTHFEGGFYQKYFAFSASNTEESLFAVIDTEALRQTGGFDSQSRFSVRTDANGICVQTENLLVRIDPVTGDQTPLVTTNENIRAYAAGKEHALIATEGAFSFFAANATEISAFEKADETDFAVMGGEMAAIGSRSSPSIRILQYEDHSDTEVFSYDSSASHDEARVSADGSRIMLFDWQKFRIYDRQGNLVNETDVPDADQVYDQQFRREGGNSYLEIIYNDGTSLVYSAMDGSLLQENTSTRPAADLYEEFTVNGLRIESPLHGEPTAYDAETGELVGVLSDKDYLTYVTSVGQNFVAQFVTADGYCYGRLLDAECRVLAELPYLCDVINNVLIFDYPTGDLRQSHIYDIEELRATAQNVLGEGR